MVYFLYLFELGLDFVIWLNEAQFGHHCLYYIDDFKRTMHHRIMKQRAQDSLEPEEHADAIFDAISLTIG